MEKTKQILAEILQERIAQDRKWGEQNHDPFRWLGILLEEIGEASKTVVDNYDIGYNFAPEEYREEMIQVAAVAVAMIESFDRHRENEKKCPGNCGFEHYR